MQDKTTTIIAAIFLGCVGVFAIMAQPILVEVLVAGGMDGGTAGAITAVEALGTAAAPILAVFWMQRVPWRLAAVFALLIVIGGNFISGSFASDSTTLMALRFAVGLLGEGTAFALTMAIISGTAQKDRNFALVIAAQVLLGVACFYFLPMPKDAGVPGVLLPLAGLAFVALLTVAWIPQPAGGLQQGPAGAKGSAGPAIAALGVMLVWCTGLGAVWAFVKLIGVAAICPECAANTADAAVAAKASADVGTALSISTGVAVVGALAAAALGDRVGRLIPVSVALVVQLVMVLLMQGQMPWLQFAVIAATFQIFWNLTGPYMMGTVALNDATGGKVSLLIPTAQIGGFFLGPTIVGFLLADQGLRAVNTVSAICMVIALLTFFPIARRIKGMSGGGH